MLHATLHFRYIFLIRNTSDFKFQISIDIGFQRNKKRDVLHRNLISKLTDYDKGAAEYISIDTVTMSLENIFIRPRNTINHFQDGLSLEKLTFLQTKKK